MRFMNLRIWLPRKKNHGNPETLTLVKYKLKSCNVIFNNSFVPHGNITNS